MHLRNPARAATYSFLNGLDDLYLFLEVPSDIHTHHMSRDGSRLYVGVPNKTLPSDKILITRDNEVIPL